MNTMKLVGLVIVLSTFASCKNTSTKKDKNELSEIQGVTKSEFMKSYFPLKVGNTWTYKRTIKNPENIFRYTEMKTTVSGWNIPQGMRYLQVGRALLYEQKGESFESYTITGKDENDWFYVDLKGMKSFRDGRYIDEYMNRQTVANIRWRYMGDGMIESMDGHYEDAKTENSTWMTILKPEIILSDPQENEQHEWSIGATWNDKEVIVPAGRFSNTLKNVTMIGGSNVLEVMRSDVPMKVNHKGDMPRMSDEDGFGCFVTKSYYAKGVGLVLEIQYDNNNQETYRMELVSFNVN